MICKFFFRLTDEEAEKMDNEFESNYLKLINRYLFFLFFIFLFYSVFIIIFFGDAITSVFLTVITLFWLFLMLLKSKVKRFRKRLKSSILFVFVLLTFIVSFFHTYTSKNAGVEYFYFCLLFAIPFYFSYKEDKSYIYLLISIISINFVGCLYLDFDFLPRSKFLAKNDYKTIKLLNILFSIASFLMDMAFVSQKDKLINGLIDNTRIKDSTIEDLTKTNSDLMKQQMLIHQLTDENIQEIFRLAESNSVMFLEKFQVFFPDFIPDILKINPNLIQSELHFCALMKLDFDTKKIAQCTNNSIRAVESKKYRIRKKLDVPSEVNINSFLLKI